jgi:hypothetical protein
MIIYVFFVHKKSVSKRKVCIIFIKNFLGFLLPTLVQGPRGLHNGQVWDVHVCPRYGGGVQKGDHYFSF